MPKIIWEGNNKDFGTYHDCDPIPENAAKLREAEGFIGKAVPYGMSLCMLYVIREEQLCGLGCVCGN